MAVSKESCSGGVTKKNLFVGLAVVAVFVLILGNILWTQMGGRLGTLEEKVQAMEKVNDQVRTMMTKAEESINAMSSTARDLENTAKVLKDLQGKVNGLEGNFGELQKDLEHVTALTNSQGEAMKQAMTVQKEALGELGKILAAQEALLKK